MSSNRTSLDPIYSILCPEHGQARVLVVGLDSVICPSLIALLTKHERAQCHRYRRQSDRWGVAVMRGLMRLAGGTLTDTHPSEVHFDRDRHARPYISQTNRDQLDLNVSRTQSCCAMILAKGGRCGIDVERIDPGIVSAELICMLSVENDEIARFTSKPADFFDRWTQIEAVLKADGRGLRDGLGIVEQGEGSDHGGQRWSIGSKSWTVGTIQTPPGVVGAYALDHERMRVSQISITEIEAVWSQRILCAHGDPLDP